MRIAATGTTTAGGPADKRNLGSPSVLVSLSSASVQRQGHSAQEPRQTGPSASSQLRAAARPRGRARAADPRRPRSGSRFTSSSMFLRVRRRAVVIKLVFGTHQTMYQQQRLHTRATPDTPTPTRSHTSVRCTGQPTASSVLFLGLGHCASIPFHPPCDSVYFAAALLAYSLRISVKSVIDRSGSERSHASIARS